MTDNVIEAAHLFQREPPPEQDSAFWEWGKEYVNGGGFLNLSVLVDDMTAADDEESFGSAVKALQAEVRSWPDLEGEGHADPSR